MLHQRKGPAEHPSRLLLIGKPRGILLPSPGGIVTWPLYAEHPAVYRFIFKQIHRPCPIRLIHRPFRSPRFIKHIPQCLPATRQPLHAIHARCNKNTPQGTALLDQPLYELTHGHESGVFKIELTLAKGIVETCRRKRNNGHMFPFLQSPLDHCLEPRPRFLEGISRDGLSHLFFFKEIMHSTQFDCFPLSLHAIVQSRHKHLFAPSRITQVWTGKEIIYPGQGSLHPARITCPCTQAQCSSYPVTVPPIHHLPWIPSGALDDVAFSPFESLFSSQGHCSTLLKRPEMIADQTYTNLIRQG